MIEGRIKNINKEEEEDNIAYRLINALKFKVIFLFLHDNLLVKMDQNMTYLEQNKKYDKKKKNKIIT